jgi:hypothetical protein
MNEVGPYLRGLVALHNLGVALDESRSVRSGALGFPVATDPLRYISDKLDQLSQELARAIISAKFGEPTATGYAPRNPCVRHGITDLMHSCDSWPGAGKEGQT